MDDLATLLHDAVEDVEPADRLGAIRERTRSHRGRRRLVVGSAVLATAAAVAGIAFVVQSGQDRGTGPSGPPSTATSGASPDGFAVPLYFVGETPAGPRLFREFRHVDDTASVAPGVLMLAGGPADPDYRTLWPEGALTVERSSGEVARIGVPAELVRRPPGMTRLEAELAVQQVVYTVTAAAGGQTAVRFELDDSPVGQVLGVPTGEPLTRAPQLDVLAHVSISNPSEGRVVEGHFSADGVGSVWEGTVLWELRAADGTVVRDGFTTTEVFDPDRLTPWQTEDIDVSDLPPGDYTFVAAESDMSGGTEGPGPTSDTRTVIVR